MTRQTGLPETEAGPPPRDSRETEQSARVAAYLLSARGMTLDTAHGMVRLSGGLSNLNYLVRIDGGPAVLRHPPAGPLPRVVPARMSGRSAA